MNMESIIKLHMFAGVSKIDLLHSAVTKIIGKADHLKHGINYKKYVSDVQTVDNDEGYFVIEDLAIHNVIQMDEVCVNLKFNRMVVINVDTGAKYTVMSREMSSKISKVRKCSLKLTRQSGRYVFIVLLVLW